MFLLTPSIHAPASRPSGAGPPALAWHGPLLFSSFTSSPLTWHFRPMQKPKIPWPHAPTHQLAVRGTYFVTGATYDKAHHFRGADRLGVLHRGLLKVAEQFSWQLEAWAMFSNHYHFIARSPADATDASSLRAMLSVLHVKSSGWINKLDHSPGRQVWFNFWDTRLTNQRSYLARLNYVHQNAVKHGLVPVAHRYPWCSAAWFERTASPAIVKAIYRFKSERIAVGDDFDVAADW
jgi:putative transposase